MTTINKLRTMATEELESLANDRATDTDTMDDIEIILQERRDMADAERLTTLIEDFADHIGTKHNGELHFGEGVNARTITEDDLERIAELLDE